MTIFKEYRDEINKIFSRYTRSGFVDYYHCRGLGRDMIDLMIDATGELSGRGEYKELFDLAGKGFLKWGKTSKDDSDGETQDFVYYVEQAWDAVYDADDAKIPHNKMYNWFESHINGSVIDYMENYLFEYLIHHFTEPKLLQRKYDFLIGKIEEAKENLDDYHYKYRLGEWQEYLLYVMADMNKPIEEIREYAKGVETYSVRETMVEIEKRYGNMDEVIAIYHELAQREDERRWPSANWHFKLKDIYKEQGDDAKYREELLAAMSINIGDEDLWKEFKGLYSDDEWPQARAAIFDSVKPGNYRIFPWYAMEERYDLIMEGVEAGGYTDRLKQYEKKLKALYPERCLTVLVDDTIQMAEQSNKRQDYRKVARNLRWIQRYPGGNGEAARLASEFREKYKKRRAMMEEISEF